jgi:cytochrome c556
MKKIFIIILGSIFFLSCNTTKKEAPNNNDEELVMYEFSEMALLMEEMYKANEDLKNKIINKEAIGDFSDKFLNIHSAVLTNPKDRDANFEIFSKAFIENQQAIFSASPDEVKDQFNLMVNSCVACHKTTCSGPIPRIKKLLIK